VTRDVPTHVSFLHKMSRTAHQRQSTAKVTHIRKLPINQRLTQALTSPKEIGLRDSATALWREVDESFYWRVTQLMLPGYSIIPSVTTQVSSGALVPDG